MKKNLTKKLMLSVLTLAFAVVSLGASTFAWFTVAETATVEGFQANVVSGAGIEIAVGSINSSKAAFEEGASQSGMYVSEFYIGKLPTLDVKKAILNDSTATTDTTWSKTLNNVSTGKVGQDAEDFAGVFYSSTGDEIENYAGLYAFKLYVRSELNGEVVLNNFALSSSSTIAPWAAGVEYTDGLGNKILPNEKVSYSVLSAARLGFVCNDATNAVYQAAVGSGKGGNTQGLSAAEQGALDVYNTKYQEEENRQITALTADETPLWETAGETGGIKEWNNSSIILKVTQGVIYEISVYVWIEGYDNECYNAIFNQQLAGQFNFTWHDGHTYKEGKCVCGAVEPAEGTDN